MSFFTDLNTVWVIAFKRSMEAHPVESLRDVHVSMEYPMTKTDYPGLWVTVEVQGDVHNVGIGHIEQTFSESGSIELRKRWTFSGYVDVTVAALTSLERARMVDALIDTLASPESGSNPFNIRDYIDSSERIGQRVRWESINLGRWAETPGTPWGTDDIIYEASISLNFEGEVVIDPQTGELEPLAGFEVFEWSDVEVDPSPGPEVEEGGEDLTLWR